MKQCACGDTFTPAGKGKAHQCPKCQTRIQRLYSDRRYKDMPLGGACWICGEMGADTRDHVVPVSRGGTNDRWNLRAAHLACNVRKGNALYTCGHPLWAPRSIESGKCAKCHEEGPNT